MIKKLFILLSAVLLLTGISYGATQSQENPAGHQDHQARMHGHNFLNLTPDQMTKIKEIWTNFRKETVYLRNDLKVKKLELRALWTVPQPDKEKIVLKTKEIIDLTTQLKMKLIDSRLESRKVLTQEQAAQVGMMGPEMFHRWHKKNRMRD